MRYNLSQEREIPVMLREDLTRERRTVWFMVSKEAVGEEEEVGDFEKVVKMSNRTG